MVIRANDPALEDGKEPFDGVAMSIAANILVGAVIDHLMPGKLLSDVEIAAMRVGHQSGLWVDLRHDDGAQSFAGHIGDVIGASPSATLYERMDNSLASTADVLFVALIDMFILFLTTDVCGVGLDVLSFTTKRLGFAFEWGHSFTKSMLHEPRRLVSDLQSAVQLMRAHTLLAGSQKVRRLKPLVQLDMAALKDRPNRNRKFALARSTAAQSGAAALDRCDAVKTTTARAIDTLRPDDLLKPGDSRFFVVEVRGGKNGHRSNSLTLNIESGIVLVKYIIPLTGGRGQNERVINACARLHLSIVDDEEQSQSSKYALTKSPPPCGEG